MRLIATTPNDRKNDVHDPAKRAAVPRLVDSHRQHDEKAISRSVMGPPTLDLEPKASTSNIAITASSVIVFTRLLS
jgi:hypothetical protein